MSYGIICMTCCKYVMPGNNQCQCDEPRFSANTVTEISLEQAIKVAETYDTPAIAKYLRDNFEVVDSLNTKEQG